jgi:hypothetical protein
MSENDKNKNDKANKEEKISDQQLAINLGFDVEKIYQSLKAEVKEDSKYKDYDTEKLNKAIYNRLSFAVHPDKHQNEEYKELAKDAFNKIWKYHPDELKKKPISIMNTGTVVMDDGFTFTIKRRSPRKEETAPPQPVKNEPNPENPPTELEVLSNKLLDVLKYKQNFFTLTVSQTEVEANKEHRVYMRMLDEQPRHATDLANSFIEKETRLTKLLEKIQARVSFVNNRIQNKLEYEEHRNADDLQKILSLDIDKLTYNELLEDTFIRARNIYFENYSFSSGGPKLVDDESPLKGISLSVYNKVDLKNSDLRLIKDLKKLEEYASSDLGSEEVRSKLLQEIDKEVKNEAAIKRIATPKNVRAYNGIMPQLQNTDSSVGVLEKTLEIEKNITRLATILKKIEAYEDPAQVEIGEKFHKDIRAIKESRDPLGMAKALITLHNAKLDYIELAGNNLIKTKKYYDNIKEMDGSLFYDKSGTGSIQGMYSKIITELYPLALKASATAKKSGGKDPDAEAESFLEKILQDRRERGEEFRFSNNKGGRYDY